MKIKVSSKSMRLKFQPCEGEYIQNVCRGQCCHGGKGGAKVYVSKSQQQGFIDRGFNIVDGGFFEVKESDDKKCPLWDKSTGFCKEQFTTKPHFCKPSPFYLNKNNTLIAKYRFLRMICYGGEGAVEMYKAHPWSLEQILGKQEAKRLTEHLDAGGGDTEVEMPDDVLEWFQEGIAAHKTHPTSLATIKNNEKTCT